MRQMPEMNNTKLCVIIPNARLVNAFRVHLNRIAFIVRSGARRSRTHNGHRFMINRDLVGNVVKSLFRFLDTNGK